MKKTFTKLLALLLVMITVFSVSPLNAFAQEESEDMADGHALVLTSDAISVVVKKSIQMSASVTNVSEQPEFKWSSSDE